MMDPELSSKTNEVPIKEVVAKKPEFDTAEELYVSLKDRLAPRFPDANGLEVKKLSEVVISFALVKTWQELNSGLFDESFNSMEDPYQLNILLGKKIIPNENGEFVSLLDYMNQKYQKLFGADASITYEAHDLTTLDPNLPDNVIKNIGKYKEVNAGVKCLKFTKGDKSMIIPIIADLNHTLPDNLLGAFIEKYNRDGDMLSGGVVLREVSKIKDGEHFNYVNTILHEIDHCVYYFFHTSYRQQNEFAVKEINFKLDSKFEEYKKNAYSLNINPDNEPNTDTLESIKKEIRELTGKMKDQLTEKHVDNYIKLQKVDAVLAEGMARRAEDAFKANLKKAIPTLTDEVDYCKSFGVILENCLPQMLLYSVGKRYVDSIINEKNQKDVYLTPLLDNSILDNLTGMSPLEIGHKLLSEVAKNRMFLAEKLKLNIGELSPERIASTLLTYDFELLETFFGEKNQHLFDDAKAQIKDKYGSSIVVGSAEWKSKFVELYSSDPAIKRLIQSIANTIASGS
ncbi:MAG: hypothetical protein WCK31_02180 [bacterium]